MPPRTGPRRKKRAKPSPAAPLRVVIIRADKTTDRVLAYRIELDDGHLVLRDGADAIIQIIAGGEWREIRSATIGDIPWADEAGDSDRIDDMQREEATLTPPPVPEPVPEPDDRRFVPSSPEEAQRVLRELHRRIAPDYQDPPEPQAGLRSSEDACPHCGVSARHPAGNVQCPSCGQWANYAHPSKEAPPPPTPGTR